MTRPDSFEDQMHRMLDGTLTPGETADFLARIAQDPLAREEWARYQAVNAGLRVYGMRPVPPGLEARIQSQLRTARGIRLLPKPYNRSAWGRIAAAAAAVVILVVGSFSAYQNQQDQALDNRLEQTFIFWGDDAVHAANNVDQPDTAQTPDAALSVAQPAGLSA